MPEYSDCVSYLCALGMSDEMSRMICQKYEDREDLEGLMDYMLLCESMVDSCVD